MKKNLASQPAHLSARLDAIVPADADQVFETVAFARRRSLNRKRTKMAKASRRKNRGK